MSQNIVGAVGSVDVGQGLLTTSNNSAWVTANTITGTAIGQFRMQFDLNSFLDTHIMNRVTCDHKVQEHELLKLKEVAPDYADEIKQTLTKNVATDIVKKMTFTKKHDKNADVHHFIGRVWVFTEDELKNMLMEARNA